MNNVLVQSELQKQTKLKKHEIQESVSEFGSLTILAAQDNSKIYHCDLTIQLRALTLVASRASYLVDKPELF